MITDDKLAEIEAKARAATQGPWKEIPDGEFKAFLGEQLFAVVSVDLDDEGHPTRLSDKLCLEDASYIATMHPAVALALVREVRGLNERLDHAISVANADAERATAAKARVAELEKGLQALADAADTVGVQHFDTDMMAPEVERMQTATTQARAILAKRSAT